MIVAGILFLGNRLLSAIFGGGGAVTQAAAVLTVESEGTGFVQVSIENGEFVRAEDQIKLYPGDRVSTSGNAHATLKFFDDTFVRLDEGTEMAIVTSRRGEENGILALALTSGTLWVTVPADETIPMTRSIETPSMTLNLPTGTETVLTETSVAVFAGDGLGVEVAIEGTDPFFIGEGQAFSLPQGGLASADPYDFRSAIDPTLVRSPFVEESKGRLVASLIATGAGTGAQMPTDGEIVLAVSSPEEGATVTSSTVVVSGTVGANVTAVRIDGYAVPLEPSVRTFSHEVALADEDQVTILIEALGTDGTVAEDVRRTVKRNREPPPAPTITAPVTAGQTYRTGRTRFEISGTAPAGSVGIQVNDYRLQLFQPGDTRWTYLASTDLQNLKFGENRFDVVVINQGGYRSNPATITVILEEGATDQVIDASSDDTSETPDDSTPVEEDEAPPAIDNPPIMPGSLTVHAPTAGISHQETRLSELLIEGNTSTRTDTIWVNDYKLRLYRSGADFWNYIADVELQTMEEGHNTYEIVARDSEGMVLDKLIYTIDYNP